MSVSRYLSCSIAVLALAGCSQIATVRPTAPRIAAVGAESEQLREAKGLQRSDPLRALGHYLAIAQAASGELHHEPSDQHARDLYNFAVGRCIDVIEEAKLNPWD